MASTLAPVEALRLLIEERLTDATFRPYVLLNRLQKADRFQTSIFWNVNLGGASVTGRAVTADVTSFDNADNVKKATLPIGARVLGHAFKVLKTDIVQAASVGAGELRNLFGFHVDDAISVILPELNRVIYEGDGTNADHGVYGMDYAMVAANDYAGIDTATYPLWGSTVLENPTTPGTSRTLTEDLFFEMDSELASKGVMYDLIVTSPAVVAKYKKVFATSRSLTVNDAAGTADLGFTGVAYSGRPMLQDPSCPAGVIYFINSSAVEMNTYNLGSANNLRDNQGRVVSTQSNSEKTNGLNFLISELPSSNPHAVQFEISVQPQLRIAQPKMIAKITDIAVT